MFRLGDTIISTNIAMADYYGPCTITRITDAVCYTESHKHPELSFSPAFAPSAIKLVQPRVVDNFAETGEE